MSEFGKILNSAIDAAQELAGDMKAATDKMIDTAQEQAPSVVASAREKRQALTDQARENIPGLIDEAKNSTEKAMDDAKAVSDKLMDTAKEVGDNAHFKRRASAFLFYTCGMLMSAQHNSTPLDARFALVGLFAYSVSLFFVTTWLGLGVFVLLLVAALLYFRISLRNMGACIAPLAFILACTVVAQIPHGIGAGLFYAARIIVLALAALSVSLAYDSAQFTRAFSGLMSPLRNLGVPVDDISTTLSLALRFIPACFDEYVIVCQAQRSRCAHFDDGGFVNKIVQRGRVFVPMLVGLFRHASVLACAMEARCYGAPGVRTCLHGEQRVGPRSVALVAAFSTFCIFMGVLL